MLGNSFGADLCAGLYNMALSQPQISALHAAVPAAQAEDAAQVSIPVQVFLSTYAAFLPGSLTLVSMTKTVYRGQAAQKCALKLVELGLHSHTIPVAAAALRPNMRLQDRC